MGNIDIVVAHYNEDIDRLRPYADKVIIYHKGDEQGPRFSVKKRINLPNLGREGHTYLYHIIENYHQLADSTIFLQGSISDHAAHGASYDNIDSYMSETEKYGFSTATLCLMKKKIPQITWSHKFQNMIENSELTQSTYGFAEYYKYIMKKDQPSVMIVFYCANFGVSKDMIHQRSLDFYQTIYKTVNQCANPEEGHYLERLRFEIFNHGIIKKIHFQKKLLFNIYVTLISKINKIYVK